MQAVVVFVFLAPNSPDAAAQTDSASTSTGAAPPAGFRTVADNDAVLLELRREKR